MGSGPQKPDHRGNFFMMPRAVQASVAWRHASLRARVILLVFMSRHDGFNNGRIALGIREIGKGIGDQNHGANGRAVAELIELGFLECLSDADHHKSRTREFRITFIPTGDGKTRILATHDYADWRPPRGRKRIFGGARTATKEPPSVADTAAKRKLSVAEAAIPSTENCGFEGHDRVAETAAHIGNQSLSVVDRSENSQSVSPVSRGAADIRIEVDELRGWVEAVVDELGYGGARLLAQSCDVPEPSLSRFRRGLALPDYYRLPLQQACGRRLPYIRWKEGRS